MEQVLSGELEFTGTFAFHRTYSVAPNPALHIDGLGIVGLPLSLRDAAAIKAQSSQAPFGMADRTVVNKSVRDTWEIDAKQVRVTHTPYVDALTVSNLCASRLASGTTKVGPSGCNKL